MTAALSEDYAYFLAKFGQPGPAQTPSKGFRANLENHLPDDFLDFIEVVGFGIWMDGYFQFCDPQRYAPIVEAVFSGDSEFDPGATHLLGYSAFGTALLWNEQHRAMEIDMLNGVITASSYFSEPKSPPNVSLGIAATNIDLEAYDAFDADGKPLFKRCLKKFGRLQPGQIYAPKLHPALGGVLELESFRPVSALESMALMSDAVGRFRLIDSRTFPPRDVRPVGL